MARKHFSRPSILALKIANDLFMHKEGITVKNLANNLKTDYKNVHDGVSQLFLSGIIKKEKLGNYNVCKLNYSNEDIIEYFKEYNRYIRLRDFRKKHPIEYGIIVETCEQLRQEASPFFICLVFGSFAKNDENKGSDIDLLFLASFSKAQNSAKKALDKINAPYQKRFHTTEQSISGFTWDLKNRDRLSIAAEIYKQPPIVFYGDDIFFRVILKEKW